MVIIRNISNKPVGVIGGNVCLPNEKFELKDKDAFCDVFDEDGIRTGEKMILPGLKAMEKIGYISIEVVKEKVEKPKKVVEEAEEGAVEEVPVKKTRTKKKKTEE